MVTMARLSVKVSLKSLGQAEDTAGSPPHLEKILSCNKQFKTAAADKTSTSKYKSNRSADLSFLCCLVPANVSVSRFCLPWKDMR